MVLLGIPLAFIVGLVVLSFVGILNLASGQTVTYDPITIAPCVVSKTDHLVTLEVGGKCEFIVNAVEWYAQEGYEIKATIQNPTQTLIFMQK